jgi:ferrous iron transport protein B
VALSFLNSIGSDFSFGNEDSERSLLSVIGKSITPVFTPMGLGEANWPATVGLFTGMFAKEAIVGTLDALYSPETSSDTVSAPDLSAALSSAFTSVGDELIALRNTLADPLGISIGDVSDLDTVAQTQEVKTATLTNMATLFPSAFAAFCYLVFVLLYAPCVAVLGAVAKEAGWRYMLLVFSWSTGLAYAVATCLYQLGTFAAHPAFSSLWILTALIAMGLFIGQLQKLGARALPPELIPVKQL